MDEGRKRTLWIAASILAAPKLADIKDGDPKNAALQTEVVSDAISKAEKIMQQIDLRWPGNRIPGQT